MLNRIAYSLIACGLMLIAWGLHYPQFYDLNWEQPYREGPWYVAMNGATSDPVKFDRMAQQWFDAREKALTPRDGCFDRGLAIALLGITLAWLSHVTGCIGNDGKPFMQSPATQGQFVFLCSVAWLSIVPGEWVYYIYTSVRSDYPWFGDVITIGCFGAAVYGLIGWPVVILGARFIMKKSVLPVPIFCKPIFGRFSFRMLLIFGALLLSLFLLLLGFTQMPTIVPSAVCMIYLLLSARAAVVSGQSS